MIVLYKMKKSEKKENAKKISKEEKNVLLRLKHKDIRKRWNSIIVARLNHMGKLIMIQLI